MAEQYAAFVIVRIVILPHPRTAASPIGVERLSVPVHIGGISYLVELIERAFRRARPDRTMIVILAVRVGKQLSHIENFAIFHDGLIALLQNNSVVARSVYGDVANDYVFAIRVHRVVVDSLRIIGNSNPYADYVLNFRIFDKDIVKPVFGGNIALIIKINRRAGIIVVLYKRARNIVKITISNGNASDDSRIGININPVSFS